MEENIKTDDIIISKLREVGSKTGKSMVLGIPAKIVKSCNIDKNTWFELKVDKNTGTVILQRIKGLGQVSLTPAGKSIEPSVQQTLIGVQ